MDLLCKGRYEIAKTNNISYEEWLEQEVEYLYHDFIYCGRFFPGNEDYAYFDERENFFDSHKDDIKKAIDIGLFYGIIDFSSKVNKQNAEDEWKEVPSGLDNAKWEQQEWRCGKAFIAFLYNSKTNKTISLEDNDCFQSIMMDEVRKAYKDALERFEAGFKREIYKILDENPQLEDWQIAAKIERELFNEKCRISPYQIKDFEQFRLSEKANEATYFGSLPMLYAQIRLEKTLAIMPEDVLNGDFEKENMSEPMTLQAYIKKDFKERNIWCEEVLEAEINNQLDFVEVNGYENFLREWIDDDNVKNSFKAICEQMIADIWDRRDGVLVPNIEHHRNLKQKVVDFWNNLTLEEAIEIAENQDDGLYNEMRKITQQVAVIAYSDACASLLETLRQSETNNKINEENTLKARKSYNAK